jgi:homoaconitate hydratase
MCKRLLLRYSWMPCNWARNCKCCHSVPFIASEKWFRVPECNNIRFVGGLLSGMGGKDVILHTLGEFKRNTRIVEFSGLRLSNLSIYASFAVCNMCTV